jgi:hypothetical protein
VKLFRRLVAVRPEVYRDGLDKAHHFVRYLLRRTGRQDEMLAFDLQETEGPKPTASEGQSA